MYKHFTLLGPILIALALHPTIGQAECRPKAWVLFDEIQTLQSLNWQISFNAAIITTEAELDSLRPQDHEELRKALRGLVEESGFLVLHLHSSDWYKQRIVDTLNEALRDKDPVYDILFFDISGTETVSLSALTELQGLRRVSRRFRQRLRSPEFLQPAALLPWTPNPRSHRGRP